MSRLSSRLSLRDDLETLAQPLEDHRHPLAAADAHGLQAERLVLGLQVVEQGGGDASTGHTERVTQRDRATGVSGLSPEIMGLGPVEASKQALRRAGMAISDVDLVEINEAFAAQVIPSYRDLGIDEARLNVNGGAIAVGHPFGMTGARIATTLINSLQFHDKTIGLETMCVGGGQGMAMIFERLS